ncbi:MAG: beta-ketoacyl synthase chain length factor [Gammaproteobacteria bacterium]|nr:beta-ketoacyl synthase chain length factor [Gammaproteobacteria bacterium]
MKLYVEAVGLLGPGLAGWENAQSVLRGEAHHVPDALPGTALPFIPANERRRLTTHIRLALATAADTVSDHPPMPSVFVSMEGDLGIVDRICQALTQPGKPVSPTHFHNSVHNTPAAYWHQAMGWHTPSTSLSGGEASFAAGLIEAATQSIEAAADEAAGKVLLICSDDATPERLSRLSPCPQPFGCGLILNAQPGRNSRWELDIDWQRDAQTAPDNMHSPSLEQLRQVNAAAAALPLLATLATGRPGTTRLPAWEGSALQITVQPR